MADNRYMEKAFEIIDRLDADATTVAERVGLAQAFATLVVAEEINILRGALEAGTMTTERVFQVAEAISTLPRQLSDELDRARR